MLPDLPRIPKMPRRTCSSNLDGSIPIVSSSIALRESCDMESLISQRSTGAFPLIVSSDSPIVRFHGCRSCPWYGSSFCFEKVVPPNVFVNGICQGRLNEVLDIAELHNSPDGLKIRKIETVERIRRHILILESNLVDYTSKRFKLLEDLKSKPLVDSNGDLIDDSNPLINSARAERELKLLEFDSYQRGLQSQIQILSTKFAELLRDDEKLQISRGEGSSKQVLNIQQLNILLSDSTRKLQELESKKEVL